MSKTRTYSDILNVFVGIVIAGIICFAVHGIPSKRFSSPSSVATASDDSAVVIISCLDLQRELNRLDPNLKLEEDGICGKRTMAAWNDVVFNRYALELWPEDAK